MKGAADSNRNQSEEIWALDSGEAGQAVRFSGFAAAMAIRQVGCSTRRGSSSGHLG